jgi:quinol monooxygenase YgiN
MVCGATIDSPPFSLEDNVQRKRWFRPLNPQHQKNRTNHFTVVEVWKDQRSNDAHELAAHTRAFRSALTPITGALYDQRWYRPL